ncbi:MAG: hypothetical protein HOO67_02115 [Candidatus Peribacteraceae bacterium]|nr:hypothetical protein [Candidatus Peribacteraceae bacterium]
MPKSAASPTGVRTRNLYDPASKEPFKFSRTKLELFLQCPRCFYLDRRCGIGQPPGPPFTLNVAVDALMKREFDYHRARSEPHALMNEFGVDAVPYQHKDLDQWRTNFHGVQVLHQATNFLFFGAVDDVWESPGGKLHVVDYKATSTQKEISLDDPWKQAYKRQMEIYQWLLRGNGLPVSDLGYFVYVNGNSDNEHFGKKLEFSMQIISYTGDDSWVDEALQEAHTCLCRDAVPSGPENCEWCAYRKAASGVE